jgi:Leucine-rich repeat (LRR) protein
MKYNQVFTLIFVLQAFKFVEPEKCPFEIGECEYCDIDNSNFTSLICNKANGLLEKIDFDIQSINSHSIYRKISIENKNIRTLPSFMFKNLEIETLSLSNNQIEFISLETFSLIKSINALDLSLNNLKSIDNLVLGFQSNILIQGQYEQLRVLNLNLNQIESVSLPFTTAFKHLNSLSLLSNQIEKLYYGTFNNLVSLKKLSLKKNKIDYIDGFIFSCLTNLTELILSKNQLTYINRILFKGLVNLDYLSLDFNLIQFIEPDSFVDLINLKYLYLDNNKLKNIESLTLSGLTNLDTLSLSYNYLEVINQYMFLMLPNLKVLILDSNIINRVDQDAFVYSKNLTLLSLNNNFLDGSNNFIEYLDNLEELQIENNRIKSSLFHFSRNLKKISCKSNYITSITTGLDGLLTNLDLSSNRLAKLNNQDFQNLQNFNELLLNDNRDSFN